MVSNSSGQNRGIRPGDPYLTLANVKAKAVLLLVALDTNDNEAITAAMIALTKAIA